MSKIKKIIFANDHAGTELKFKLIEHFKKKYEIINHGTNEITPVDYPDYARLMVNDILDGGENVIGIAICGTGVGMSIALNKFKNILCGNIFLSETAALAREHDNCNVIALSARFVSVEENIKIVENYLNAVFEIRHDRRIKKIHEIENENYISIKNAQS